MQSAAQQSEVAPGEILHEFYPALLHHFGPQRWWPARTRLEVILGAVLTQNASWHNATLALRKLRKAGLLRWQQLRRASVTDLEEHVRPAGFYRQKARTIRSFVDWLMCTHRGSLNALLSLPPAEARRQLLRVKGLGPETVDAIMLYAGRRPFFVADAYTRRILSRHGLLPETANYAAAQDSLHQHLPADHKLFNEFHALLVEVGKRYCQRRAPLCGGCPLERFLPGNRAIPALRPISNSQGVLSVLQVRTA